MIALVAGDVAVRRADHVVVETASGVGYRLAVSGETLRHVPAVGGQVSLHAHLIVRDDSLNLYGFAAEEERDLFLLLIGVQGVGPKVAQAVPGIGKRTAERIVVELREKAGVTPDEDDGPIVVRRADDPRTIARDGLLELGFDAREADALLREAAGESAEELLAAALREARR